jgi:hypothetical protein
LTAAGGGALQIKGALTISGAGAASTTIDGGSVGRVLDVGSATAFVTGVTIKGGRAPDGTSSARAGGSGGGIRNAGVLTLTDASVVANRAGDALDSPDTVAGATWSARRSPRTTPAAEAGAASTIHPRIRARAVPAVPVEAWSTPRAQP